MRPFPVVTVGLPVFNQALFLDTAVQSVVSQTFTDWELILIDDGSTDGSAAIARRWAGVDPRIRFVADGQNRGLPTRLNQIARLAEGRYLARMDADDQMLPVRLARQVSFLTENPAVDVLGSAARLLDETGQVIGIRHPKLAQTGEEAARHGCFVHPTIMGKTAWFRQNPYTETLRFTEDHDLWVRAFSTSTFRVLPEILLNYRQRNGWQKHIGAMQELRSLVATWPVSSTENWWLRACFWLKQLLFSVFNTLNVSQKTANNFRQTIKQQADRVGEPLFVQIFTVPVSLRFMAGQAAFWRSRGYRLHVVCSGEDETRKFAEQEKISYDVVPFRRGISLVHDLICFLKLYHVLHRLQPAVVQGNTPKAGFLAMLAARLAGVQTRIYELHGLPLETRRGLVRAALQLIEKLTCQLASQVLAVSPSLRAVMLRERLILPEKITVPHHGSCNGMDALNRFNPAHLATSKTDLIQQKLRSQGKVLGFIGRLCADKGLTELVETWALLCLKYPDVTLLILGAAECRTSREKRYFLDLQDDNRVKFVDWTDEVELYLSLMTVLLLPTHREGMPTVLLEAAAMQIPVVASRVTGVIDAVLDGETGFLVDNHVPKSFAEAVSVYLDNPDLARQHGQQARSRVLRDFRPDDVWAAKAALLQTHRL